MAMLLEIASLASAKNELRQCNSRHPREGGDPVSFATRSKWIPAFAGMTAVVKRLAGMTGIRGDDGTQNAGCSRADYSAASLRSAEAICQARCSGVAPSTIARRR